MAIEISKNFIKRVITALAVLPLVLVPVWLGGPSILVLLAVAATLMAIEWNQLTGHKGNIIGYVTTVLISILPVVVYEADPGLLDGRISMVLGVSVVAFFVSFRGLKLLPAGIWPFIGGLYISFLLFPVLWLRDMGSGDGHILLIWILFAVWGMDVGGYFAGKGIGGPKLAPVISPKKTWAGLLGGMLLAALVCAAISAIFSWWQPLVAGLAASAVAVVAQVGDLYESALKRHFGVKDSGDILPGHGGILDRVDGLVFGAGGVALSLSLVFEFGG